MCIPQGALDSIKIQALSLPLAPTQSNDRFKKLPCSQKDNVSTSQKTRRESVTEATSLLDRGPGNGRGRELASCVVVETKHGSCKAGNRAKDGEQLPSYRG